MRRSLVPYLLAFAFAAGCASTYKHTPKRPALISHIAFVTLSDKAEAQALIDDCNIYLATIPGVVSYACGTHLDTGRGEAVDSNYDVGIYLGFNSQEDLDRYVTHHNHVHVVAKWKPKLTSLRVHDIIDRKR